MGIPFDNLALIPGLLFLLAIFGLYPRNDPRKLTGVVTVLVIFALLVTALIVGNYKEWRLMAKQAQLARIADELIPDINNKAETLALELSNSVDPEPESQFIQCPCLLYNFPQEVGDTANGQTSNAYQYPYSLPDPWHLRGPFYSSDAGRFDANLGDRGFFQDISTVRLNPDVDVSQVKTVVLVVTSAAEVQMYGEAGKPAHLPAITLRRKVYVINLRGHSVSAYRVFMPTDKLPGSYAVPGSDIAGVINKKVEDAEFGWLKSLPTSGQK
jgi:hypothetical protein